MLKFHSLRHFVFTLLFLAQLSIASVASAMNSEDRRAFLDAIRPEAAQRAGQPVRFKVNTLNQDGIWAVLVGELMAVEGKTMDWNKAKSCEPDLDKMLWVVAKKEKTGWRVLEMEICASEPPYWYLKPKEAFTRPCGIYAGLETGKKTVEQQCRAYQKR